MTTVRSAAATTRPYDNNGQYSRTGILRYEKIFGEGYVSTGGPETTDYLCSKLDGVLRPGVRVLDVGSGIGGAAFDLARRYGATVLGIDLSPEMVAIAHERAAQSGVAESVRFLIGDIMEESESIGGPFDVAWSRDAFMHIPDKARLFARLHDLLADGGRLVITDYARGRAQGSPEFEAYAGQTGYHMTDPDSYGELLRAAGFVDVVVEDATDRFIDIMRRESGRLAANRDDFVGTFSEDDLNYLMARWAMKDRFCRAGDMKWGIYQATKGS